MDALRVHDPAQLGPYRLLGRLGAGGMWQVYLGRAADGRLAAESFAAARETTPLPFSTGTGTGTASALTGSSTSSTPGPTGCSARSPCPAEPRGWCLAGRAASRTC
jgi:hypothetical protein